jgi:hypothetical protein
MTTLYAKALERITAEELKHQRGEVAELPLEVLRLVRIDIERMSTDPAYISGYQRQLYDSWHGELVDFLGDVAYWHQRLQKSKAKKISQP